jgi:hypothetical protein
VLEEFVGRSDHWSHGERVVHGQHLMQASSDIFLGGHHSPGCRRCRGATSTCGNSVIGRERRSSDDAPGHHGLPRPGLCERVGPACARSGDRISIASYLASSDAFDRALVECSEAYADQTIATMTPSSKPNRTAASHPNRASGPTATRPPGGAPTAEGVTGRALLSLS